MHANLTASNSTVLLQDRQDISQYNFPALIFGVLLIVVIICGNLLVCLSVHSEKALKTTTNYFIVSLAVADLMLAVVVLPLFVYAEVTIVDPYLDITSVHWALMGPEGCLFQGGVWSLNMTICDCLMTMDVMLCTASIFNLCAISIDRFIAVVIPLNYNRKHVDQRQMFLLAGTWVLALAVASPVMFGINNVPRRDPSLCKLEDDDYVVYSSVCSFFIPCPIMLLLYCGMFRGLRRWEEARKAKLRSSLKACRKLQGLRPPRPPLATLPPLASLPPPLPPIIERDVPDQDTEPCPEHTCSFAPPGFKGSPVATVAFPYRFTSEPPKRKRAKINGRERKAMKVLPVVVGAFLLCWTPFFVVHTLRARCPSCPVPPSVMSTVTWLGYVNSALNPIIYTVFNTEFRNFFKRFLHSCCSRS